MIGGVCIDAVIDTGAVRTLISSPVYNRVAASVGFLRHSNVALRSVSGNVCQITGELDLPLTIHGVPYTQTTLVAEMGQLEMLIGMDFLHENRATIDLEKGLLKLPTQVVPLRPTKLPDPLPVRLCEDTHVGARTERLVQCAVEAWEGQTGLFESCISLQDQTYLGDCLVKVGKRGKVQLPLHNNSPTHCVLLSVKSTPTKSAQH